MKNSTVMYKGAEVEFIGRKGGWTTIINTNGTQVKVRNGEVSEVKVAKPVKAAKVETTTDTTKLLNPDLTRYTEFDVRTTSGRKALDIDDPVAAKLRGQHVEDMYEVAGEEIAKVRGLPASAAKGIALELKNKYQHLNPGMQRMNVGNVIRGEKAKAERAKAPK